jgi:hypothetical protein
VHRKRGLEKNVPHQTKRSDMSIPPAQTSCSNISYPQTPGPGQCYIYLAQNAYHDCDETSDLKCDSSINYSFPTNPLSGQVVPMSCVGLINCPCPSGAYAARCGNHIVGSLPAGVSNNQNTCCSKDNQYRQICASIISDLTADQQETIASAYANNSDYGVTCTPPRGATPLVPPTPGPAPAPAPPTPQTCPPGQFLKDGYCQCPSGLAWNGTACVRFHP